MSDEEAAETLPKFMWIPASDVAKAAVEGLDAGRAVVIPGGGQPGRSCAGLPSPEVAAAAPDGAHVTPRSSPIRPEKKD